MKLLKKILFLAVFIIAVQMGTEAKVYAAEGRMIIGLSDKNMEVGSTVKVTLSAIEDSTREKAITDMEFSYDTSVFSFVSCDSDDYRGGAGGKVLVRGERVNIILKAIDSGSGRVVVRGSNGRTKESGETLEAIEAAGVTIQTGSANGDLEENSGENTNPNTNSSDGENTNQNSNPNTNSSDGENTNQNTNGSAGESVASNDNSLSALSLSAGELSPEFSYAITEYTAKVPYNVTGVEVNARTAAEKAEVEEITGNTDLQIGENTITVTVRAENGEKTQYTILLLREAQTQEDSENIVEENQMEEYESKLELWEKEYNKLNQKYEAQKSTSTKIIIILVVIILILIIICINLLLFIKTEKGKKNGKKITKDKKRRNVSTGNKNKNEEWLDVEDEVEIKKPKAPRKPKKSTLKRDMGIIDFDDL